MRCVSKYDETINKLFFSFSFSFSLSVFNFPVELTVASQKPTIAGTPTTIVSTTTDGGTTTSSHRRRQHSMPNGLENFQDLFIETTNSATNEPFGHFIGYPFVTRPAANVEPPPPLWVRDTEWLPGDHHRRPDWNHEDVVRGSKPSGKTTKRQIWDTGGGGVANNDQSMMSDGCVNNVWYQKSLHTEKIHLKWILDSDVNGGSNSNITIKFRYVFMWIEACPIQMLIERWY
jgi:hypothetical protein